MKALITLPHSFFVKKVAGIPLITRIIKVLQSAGITEVFIMSNILNLDAGNSIQIIRKKEEADEKLGSDYLIIDIPVVFNRDFLVGLLASRKSGILSFSKIKEEETSGIFIPVQKDQDIRKAEKALLKSLRKPHDTLISRTLNRPVSLFVSRFLMHTPMTPNQITAVVFLIGVLASYVLIAYPTYWGGFIGGLLFHLSSVLDGCDGEIARLKFQGSRLGVWLDNISDDLTNFLFAGALGIYSATYLQQTLYLTLGLTAMGVFLLAKILQYWMIALGHQEEDMAKYEFEIEKQPAQGFKKIILFFFLVGKNIARNDFMAFSLMIGGFLGILHIGTWAVFIFMSLLSISVIVNFVKTVLFSNKTK